MPAGLFPLEEYKFFQGCQFRDWQPVKGLACCRNGGGKLNMLGSTDGILVH